MQVPDTSLIQVLSGSLLGLFGGVGATALWEGLVKPHRERQNLARSLATEVWLNSDRVKQARTARKDESLPYNLRLSTLVFQSTAARLAELPEELLPPLVRMYHRFDSVNVIVARSIELNDQIRVADPNAAPTLRAHLDELLEALDRGLQVLTTDMGELLPMLARYSRFSSHAWLPLVYRE